MVVRLTGTALWTAWGRYLAWAAGHSNRYTSTPMVRMWQATGGPGPGVVEEPMAGHQSLEPSLSVCATVGKVASMGLDSRAFRPCRVSKVQ